MLVLLKVGYYNVIPPFELHQCVIHAVSIHSEIFMYVTQSAYRQKTAASSEAPERNEPKVVVRTRTMGRREKKM
jgi:hypothetical protein